MKPAEINTTRDPENPLYTKEINGYEYSFTLRTIREEDREWLKVVLDRQMEEIHIRAFAAGKAFVREGIKEALNL